MKFCCYCCSVPKLYIALCKLHGLLHTRLLCPPLSPGVCLHSCPIESVMLYLICCPFSFCLQSFPASGSFPMGQLFISGGQSIGDSVLPMNIQGWFLLGLTGLISLLSKGLSRVFSSTVYIQVTAYKAKSDERKAKYLWGDFMYNYVQQGNSILSLSRLP